MCLGCKDQKDKVANDMRKTVENACNSLDGIGSPPACAGRLPVRAHLADRFAIIASGMDSVDQVARYVEQRLDASFRAPFRVGDHDLRVFVKVGIAMFPEDRTDAGTLLRHAEAALKKAKIGSEGNLFFTQEHLLALTTPIRR